MDRSHTDYRRDGRMAWAVVGGLAIAQLVSWGVLYYAVGVMVDSMRNELGWSTATTGGAFSVALLVSGALAVPVGRWLDAHGARALMSAGSVLAVLLVLAWSQVETVLGLYVVWAGIGAAMAMVLYEPAFAVITNWFDLHRRRAITTLTTLGALASFVFAPLSAWLISISDWRRALVALAVVLAAVTVPIHLLVLRRSPAHRDPAGPAQISTIAESASRHAAHDPAFWLLTAAVAMASATSSALSVHLVPALLEDGHNLGFAAGALGFIGVALIPGRLIFGMLARLPPVVVTTASFALPAIALIALPTWSSPLAVISFAITFGLGNGMKTPILAMSISNWYGSDNYGVLSGIAALPIRIALAAGPALAGVLHSLTADYDAVLSVLIALSAVAALTAALAETLVLKRTTTV